MDRFGFTLAHPGDLILAPKQVKDTPIDFSQRNIFGVSCTVMEVFEGTHPEGDMYIFCAMSRTKGFDRM
jgi:vacuolar-type H+-ATPase subunit D/Vma8